MTALLEVTDLCVDYSGLRAVDGLSISLAHGTIMGLIGPNGAGKTTTIDALCGFVPQVRGSILLDGHPIDSLPPHMRARAGLVRTFQSIELFVDLSVEENLLVATSTSRWWSPFVDAVAPRRHVHRDDVNLALDTVGLRSLATARPSDLSHGQRRLVGVARALASRPKLVLLDEPAAGLDPAETASLGQMLRNLPELGIAVLLVDHDMSLVLDVCDRLTVVDFGQVIASGVPMDVREDPSVISAYLGGGS